VVDVRQDEAVALGLVRHGRPACRSLAVAAAEDVHRDRQLVAAHLRLGRDFVRIHVDQLDHPVAVGAAGRGEQVDHRLAGHLQRRRQRRAGVGQHVRCGRSSERWSVTSQGHTVPSLMRTGRGTNGTGLAGSDTYSSKAAPAGAGFVERQRAAGGEARLQVRAAGSQASGHWRAAPAVRAGLVDQHRRRVELRRAVLQVLVEEGQHDVAAELLGGVAGELQRAQRRTLVVHAAVAPRAHHQRIHAVVLVLRFGGGVGVRRRRRCLPGPSGRPRSWSARSGALRQDAVERLLLPVAVVGRMLEQLFREVQLVDAVDVGVVGGRAGAQEGLVVVVECR
jgi:hypothetical protein